MNGLNKEPRLRFTDEERADPALEKPIRKADKAAAKADKAQAKIPKKQVRQKTVDPETGKVTTKLVMEDKKKPPSKLSHAVRDTPANAALGKAHRDIRETEQDNVGAESAHKSTRYYIDEMHLLLKEEQTAAYTVEIWKRFRKWGGIPTGITQNVKDLLSSREVENIFENSDFVYMLNQAGGDRQILAKQLGISPHQLSYVTHSSEGEGLLFYGSTILPFVDHFPKNTELYRIMTTKPQELKKEDE